MKLINQKNAFTLVELVISILISSVIFLIVFTFIANSIENLTFSHTKTVIVNQVFSFRDKINRTVRGGYMNVELLGTGENSILFLKNVDSSKGMLFGVVDSDTMKLQKNYIYGDNVIGYRSLSKTEVDEIDLDNNKIYDLSFFQDKIYEGMTVKDFKAEFYNSGAILDLYLSSLITYNKSLVGESFTGITIKPENIIEFNLDF